MAMVLLQKHSRLQSEKTIILLSHQLLMDLGVFIQ